MDDEMIELTWYVEDGFVGADRPQTMTIYKSDLEGLDDEQVDQLLQELIWDEFTQTIYPEFEEGYLEEAIALRDQTSGDDDEE